MTTEKQQRRRPREEAPPASKVAAAPAAAAVASPAAPSAAPVPPQMPTFLCRGAASMFLDTTVRVSLALPRADVSADRVTSELFRTVLYSAVDPRRDFLLPDGVAPTSATVVAFADQKQGKGAAPKAPTLPAGQTFRIVDIARWDFVSSQAGSPGTTVVTVLAQVRVALLTAGVIVTRISERPAVSSEAAAAAASPEGAAEAEVSDAAADAQKKERRLMQAFELHDSYVRVVPIESDASEPAVVGSSGNAALLYPGAAPAESRAMYLRCRVADLHSVALGQRALVSIDEGGAMVQLQAGRAPRFANGSYDAAPEATRIADLEAKAAAKREKKSGGVVAAEDDAAGAEGGETAAGVARRQRYARGVVVAADVAFTRAPLKERAPKGKAH